MAALKMLWILRLGVVTHTFNPSTVVEAGGSLEFGASLVYTSSSRTARATQ